MSIGETDMQRTSHQIIADIRQIDRHIDGIRLELYRRGNRPGMSADEWQLAWDRNLDLKARHNDLFRTRGALQVQRDAAINQEYSAEQRAKRRSLRAA
jgi:hypothetical protein